MSTPIPATKSSNTNNNNNISGVSASSQPSPSSATASTPFKRSKQVQKIRVDVQRSRGGPKPWEVEDIQSMAAQRYFPANEVWQTDNSVNAESVVKALPASNLIRETMAPPTIDAWPRKQNKISSLSQKPSDAENIPPLMRKLNKLVWEGLRSVGLLVDKCMTEYERDERASEIDVADSKNRTFSELSTSRLVMEIIHRFMDNVAFLEKSQREDCTDVLQQQKQHHRPGSTTPSKNTTRPNSAASSSATSSPYTIEEQKKLALELVEENKRVKKVLKDLCNAVARWSIFEQAGDIFSKCFATYEAAITEVMKECADCVDEVLSVFMQEISSLRRKLATTKNEIRNYMEERSKFIAEKEQQRLRAEQANAEKQEILAKYIAKEKDLKSIRFEIEDREKTIAKVNEENDLLSKQFTAQENKIANLSGQLAAANEKIESLNIHVAELKRTVTQSESVASQCATETLSLRQQLVSAKGTNAGLKSDLNKLQSDRNVLRQQVLSLTANNTSNKQTTSEENAPSSSFSNSHHQQQQNGAGYIPPFFDINEWIEVSCRNYVSEINKRLDSAFYGDGVLYDFRSLLLQQQSAVLTPIGSFVPPASAETQTSGVQNPSESQLMNQNQNQSSNNNNNNNNNSNTQNNSTTTTTAPTTTTSTTNHNQIHHPEIKNRNPTAVQIVSIADQVARPFFVGMGEDVSVPPALRYVGKIPNMKFGVETATNLIIAFFRDTAENFPKHVLADTLDYSYQIIYSQVVNEQIMMMTKQNNNQSGIVASMANSTSIRRKNGMTSSSTTPVTLSRRNSQQPHISNSNSSSGFNNNNNASTAVSDPSTALTNSQNKSLLSTVNHWIAFHLDCEDAVPPLYNILYASRWHSNNAICRFFDAAIRFDAPASLWFAVGEAISTFKRNLEHCVPDVFSITEPSVQEAFKKTFSNSLTPAAMTRVSIVIHQFFQELMDKMDSQQQQTQNQKYSSSHEISLRTVFTSGMDLAKRKHRRMLISRQTKEETSSPILWAADSVDESSIIREIRNECILSWFDLINELGESVIDRAIISPEGHVTPYSVADAILHVDPVRPKSSMDRIMQTLFGKEIVPEHLKNLHLHHHHSQNSDREGEKSENVSVNSNNKDRKSPARADEMNVSQREQSLTSFDSSNNNNTDANNSTTRHKNIEHLTKEERETKLQKLLEEDLLMMGGENNKNKKNQNQDDEDDDEDAPKQFKNYSELYRNKKYTYGDTLLVHDALSRLRMIPLARYWIPPSNNEN